MNTISKQRNIIIDGNNHISICLYRARSNILRDCPDRLEEYIEGAVRKLYLAMLRKLQRELGEFSSYYLVWDSATGSAWRKELVEGYKGTRSHLAELPMAIKAGKQIAEELFITNIEIEGAEADDAIYALCRMYSEDENIIISRDNDMLQIVQQGYAARVFDPVSKKNLEVPEYDIVDFKALAGDSSDNISGLKGIGPAKALKILKEGIENALTADEKQEVYKYRKIISLGENPRYEENMISLKHILNERMEEF